MDQAIRCSYASVNSEPSQQVRRSSELQPCMPRRHSDGSFGGGRETLPQPTIGESNASLSQASQFSAVEPAFKLFGNAEPGADQRTLRHPSAAGLTSSPHRPFPQRSMTNESLSPISPGKQGFQRGSRRSTKSQSITSEASVCSNIPGNLDLWPVWDRVLGDACWEACSVASDSMMPHRVTMFPTSPRLSDPSGLSTILSSAHATSNRGPTNQAQPQDWFNAVARSASRRLQPFVVHPTSARHIIWLVIGITLVTHDVVMTPLSVFDMQETVASKAIAWAGLAYWSVDLPLSFLVGFHDKATMVLVTRVSQTAARYASSWFPLDALLLAMDWSINLADSWLQAQRQGAMARAGAFVRAVRVLRTFRLIRFIRTPMPFKHITRRLLGRSEYLSLTFGIFSHMCGILLVNHFIACLWYWVGLQEHGWVDAVIVNGASESTLYITALHWSLTQFTPASMAVQPVTFTERVVAVAILLFALVTFSSFVSSITNLMTNLRTLSSAEAKQFVMLDRYLHERNIPLHLSVRIRRHLEHLHGEQQRNLQERDVDLLQKLSTPLHMELRYELHFPLLSKHPFFFNFASAHLAVAQRLCFEALKPTVLCSGDVLFSPGEAAWAMYVVVQGTLSYNLHAAVSPRLTTHVPALGKLEVVKAEQWFCEAVLWTPWEHRGEMRACTGVTLLALEAEKFHTVVGKNRAAAQQPAAYAAEVIEQLRACKQTKELTDLDADILDCAAMAQRAFDTDDVSEPSVQPGRASVTSSAGSWLTKMSSGNSRRRESLVTTHEFLSAGVSDRSHLQRHDSSATIPEATSSRWFPFRLFCGS